MNFKKFSIKINNFLINILSLKKFSFKPFFGDNLLIIYTGIVQGAQQTQ